MSALSILQLAQALLTGGQVAKAEAAPGSEDPDALQNKDGRAEGGAPTEEALNAARQEAQAGQQAAAAAAPDGGGAPGEGGAPAPGGEGQEGGAGGSTEPDADDQGGPQGEVTKAEVMDSLKFMAEFHGITGEEVAKAFGFTGLEGDPSRGQQPLGKGEELLEAIATGQKNHEKILEAIASFLQELTTKTVALGTEVGKSLEAAQAAQVTADSVKGSLDTIMRVAPAVPAKATVEVVKAEGGPGGAPRLTSADLFKAALTGDMSPTEVAAANRQLHYGR